MFPGAVLACAVVLVLTVRRQHSPRSAKTLGERCPARGEACGGRRESPGPASRADDALGPPPLTSQIPCSSATGIHLSSASLRDSVGFVKQAHASQPPTLPQVTDENAILRASEKDREQGRKEITHDRAKTLIVQKVRKPSTKKFRDGGREVRKGRGKKGWSGRRHAGSRARKIKQARHGLGLSTCCGPSPRLTSLEKAGPPGAGTSSTGGQRGMAIVPCSGQQVI